MSHDHVSYFASYEIISHPASFGQYLASDLREVTNRGVAHVMASFMENYYMDHEINNMVLKDTHTERGINSSNLELSTQPEWNGASLSSLTCVKIPY